ncbi:MAG: hypothetical protein IJU66_06205 [Oscillospiraceae bacterium]|nr:hypothetical protein [Oscillospiraceae bacterium]
MIAVFITILCCAATPRLTTQWWTAAFAPLCDGWLTGEVNAEGIVLRSKLGELFSLFFR